MPHAFCGCREEPLRTAGHGTFERRLRPALVGPEVEEFFLPPGETDLRVLHRRPGRLGDLLFRREFLAEGVLLQLEADESRPGRAGSGDLFLQGRDFPPLGFQLELGAHQRSRRPGRRAGRGAGSPVCRVFGSRPGGARGFGVERPARGGLLGEVPAGPQPGGTARQERGRLHDAGAGVVVDV